MASLVLGLVVVVVGVVVVEVRWSGRISASVSSWTRDQKDTDCSRVRGGSERRASRVASRSTLLELLGSTSSSLLGVTRSIYFVSHLPNSRLASVSQSWYCTFSFLARHS